MHLTYEFWVNFEVKVNLLFYDWDWRLKINENKDHRQSKSFWKTDEIFFIQKSALNAWGHTREAYLMRAILDLGQCLKTKYFLWNFTFSLQFSLAPFFENYIKYSSIVISNLFNQSEYRIELFCHVCESVVICYLFLNFYQLRRICGGKFWSFQQPTIYFE